jgi:hypothetical protein
LSKKLALFWHQVAAVHWKVYNNFPSAGGQIKYLQLIYMGHKNGQIWSQIGSGKYWEMWGSAPSNVMKKIQWNEWKQMKCKKEKGITSLFDT